MAAKTRLERDSATVILAPELGLRRPLIGCSPIEVAMPSWERKGWGLSEKWRMSRV